MKARLVAFGEIEIDGESYDYDVVIDGGKIRRRKKKASKAYRDKYGHTPVSIEENVPWGGRCLIIGTGARGGLPIMPKVLKEARRRGIEVIAVPTKEACRRISKEKSKEVRAILHVTC